MASSCESAAPTTTVCQTCGDKGELQLLIYCVQCRDSAVHHYCLDKFSPDDDNITWMCEECTPKVPKVDPFRKSERINLRKYRAVEYRIKWRKRVKKNGSSISKRPAGMKDGLFKPAQLTGGCSFPIKEKKNQLSFDDTCGNQESTKERRLILEDGVSSEEESEFVKANVPQSAPSSHFGPLNRSHCQPSLEPDNHLYSQPVIDPNKECRKQRRRLILEDVDSSEEESELVKANVPQSAPSSDCGPLNMSYCQPSLEPDNHLYAQPVIDPVWRGSFSITSGKNETLVGLMAHLSSKACSKVYDAANAFPPVLNVEILPRCDVWPKSFQKSPPTDNSIALYFFPESERDEKVFDSLLDDIIEHNLALTALIGDAALLVFSSLELPQQHWRFRRKYYLWGVFRQQQYSVSLVRTESPVAQSSGTECVRLTKHTNQSGSKDVKGLSVTATIWSPPSPISTGSSHVSNRPYSPFLYKAKSSSPDSYSSRSSKLIRPDKTKQGRDKVWGLTTDQELEKEGKLEAHDSNSPQPEEMVRHFVEIENDTHMHETHLDLSGSNPEINIDFGHFVGEDCRTTNSLSGHDTPLRIPIKLASGREIF